jgi:hypothetical protein
MRMCQSSRSSRFLQVSLLSSLPIHCISSYCLLLTWNSIYQSRLLPPLSGTFIVGGSTTVIGGTLWLWQPLRIHLTHILRRCYCWRTPKYTQSSFHGHQRLLYHPQVSRSVQGVASLVNLSSFSVAYMTYPPLKHNCIKLGGIFYHHDSLFSRPGVFGGRRLRLFLFRYVWRLVRQRLVYYPWRNNVIC